VATLSLATTEVWNDKSGQRQEKTEWHRVVLWGKQAESLQEYLLKGRQIYIEGRLQTRQWDDRDGKKRYTTEIRADRLVLLGSRGNSGSVSHSDSQEQQAPTPGGSVSRSDSQEQQAPTPDGAPTELTEDDIPF